MFKATVTSTKPNTDKEKEMEPVARSNPRSVGASNSTSGAISKRRASEPILQKEVQPGHFPAGRRRGTCSRLQVMSCSTDYFSDDSSAASGLTEQAKQLSQEEMDSLEIDIFKPLDFYELLFNRMKISGKEATTGSHADEQSK